MSNTIKTKALKYFKHLPYAVAMLLIFSSCTDEKEEILQDQNFDQVENDITLVEGEILSSTEELEALNIEEDCDAEIEQAKSDTTEYSKEIKEIETEINKFEVEENKKTLTSDLDNTKILFKSLKELLEGIVDEYELNNMSAEKLLEINEECKKTIANLNSANNKASEDINNLSEAFESLTSEEMEQFYKDIKENTDTISTNGEVVEIEVKTSKETAENIAEESPSEEIQTVITEFSNREVEVDQLQAILDENIRLLDSLNTAHDFIYTNNLAKTDIAALKAEHDATLEAISSTNIEELSNQEVVDLTAAWNKTIEDNQEEINSIRDTLNSYMEKYQAIGWTEALEEFKLREEDLDTEQEALNSINAAIQDILDQFENNAEFQVLNFESNTNSFDGNVNTLVNRVGEVSDMIDGISTAIDNATAIEDLSDVDNQIAVIEDSIATLDGLKVAYNDVADDLTQDYQVVLDIIEGNEELKAKLNTANQKLTQAKNNLNSNVDIEGLTQENNDLSTQKNDKETEINDNKIKSEVEGEISATNADITTITGNINTISSDIAALQTIVDGGTMVAQSEIDGINTDIENIDFTSIESAISAIHTKIATITDSETRNGLTTDANNLTTLVNGLKADVQTLESGITKVQNDNDALTPTVTYHLNNLLSADFDGTEITIDAENNTVDITNATDMSNFLANIADVTVNKADATLETIMNLNGVSVNLETIQTQNSNKGLNARVNLVECTGNGNVKISTLKSLLDFETPNGGYYDEYEDWIPAPYLGINPNGNNFSSVNIDFEGETLTDRIDFAYIIWNIGKTNSPYNMIFADEMRVNNNIYLNSQNNELTAAGIEMSNAFETMENVTFSNASMVGGKNLGDYAKTLVDLNILDKIANISIGTTISNNSMLFMLEADGDLKPGMTEVLTIVQRDGNYIPGLGLYTDASNVTYIPEKDGHAVSITTETIDILQDYGLNIGGFGQAIIYSKTGNVPLNIRNHDSGNANASDCYILADINSEIDIELHGSFLGGNVIAGGQRGAMPVYVISGNNYAGLGGGGSNVIATSEDASEVVDGVRVLKANLGGMAGISTGRLPANPAGMTEGFNIPGTGNTFTMNSNEVYAYTFGNENPNNADYQMNILNQWLAELDKDLDELKGLNKQNKLDAEIAFEEAFGTEKANRVREITHALEEKMNAREV